MMISILFVKKTAWPTVTAEKVTSTLPSLGPQLAEARVTSGPSWMNPGLGMGTLEAEPVGC